MNRWNGWKSGSSRVEWARGMRPGHRKETRRKFHRARNSPGRNRRKRWADFSFFLSSKSWKLWFADDDDDDDDFSTWCRLEWMRLGFFWGFWKILKDFGRFQSGKCRKILERFWKDFGRRFWKIPGMVGSVEAGILVKDAWDDSGHPLKR